MRLWYLSHRRPAKAQASLRICAVSPEPSLFAHMKYGSRRRVRPKIRHLAHWMAAHAHLKNEFTEDKKYHNLMRWIIYQSEESFQFKAQRLHWEMFRNFNYLLVCLFWFNVAFNNFSVTCITKVSGCNRELNAHFYSAASLKYHAPDT